MGGEFWGIADWLGDLGLCCDIAISAFIYRRGSKGKIFFPMSVISARRCRWMKSLFPGFMEPICELSSRVGMLRVVDPERSARRGDDGLRRVGTAGNGDA